VVAATTLAQSNVDVWPADADADQNGSRFQTARGTIHMILAILIFAAIIVAASKLGSTLQHRPRLFYVASIAWFLIVAIELVRIY
jgi:hypothetical protein